MSLRDFYNSVVAEDLSPAQAENQAHAIRRYVEHELGVTDQEALHKFFNELYELLNDGTPFDEVQNDVNGAPPAVEAVDPACNEGDDDGGEPGTPDSADPEPEVEVAVEAAQDLDTGGATNG